MLVRHVPVNQEQSNGAAQESGDNDGNRTDLCPTSTSAYVIPGCSSEKNVAASITPAAALSKASCVRAEGRRNRSTHAAPTAVPRPASKLAMNPSQKMSQSCTVGPLLRAIARGVRIPRDAGVQPEYLLNSAAVPGIAPSQGFCMVLHSDPAWRLAEFGR